jgi:pantoate--beta-alanine ligase
MTSSLLLTVSTVSALRSALLPWRESGKTVALVPTMGALHRGHMALVAEARRMADKVVVSIFVNPLQFSPSEDLARYPRPIDQDRQLLTEAGCDLLYMPDAAVMYPEDFVTAIDPGPLGSSFEGKFRPNHFTGVATVVSKLLMQAMPDIALFGEKDYQQLLVIRRVAKDLDIPAHIHGVTTVRDVDGLALSSRNVYLSVPEREQAAALPKILGEVAQALHNRQNVTTVLEDGIARLQAVGFTVDYLELADAVTLTPVKVVARSALAQPARLLTAVRIGSTRLIDNMPVSLGS